MENRIKPLFVKKFLAPLFLLLLLSLSIPVDAIQPRTVAWISAGTGLSVLGACYAKGWFKPLKKEKENDSQTAHEEGNKKKFHWDWNNTLSIIGSLGIALCTYRYLWHHTPPGHISKAEQKVKKAESELNQVSAYPLAYKTFDNEEKYIDFFESHYNTDLWLVEAKKEIGNLMLRASIIQEQLKKAEQHLKIAKSEAHNKLLCNNCTILEASIENFCNQFNTIEQNLKSAFKHIRKIPEYFQQVKIDDDRKATRAKAKNAHAQKRNLRRVAKEISHSQQELSKLTRILSQHNLPKCPKKRDMG